MVGLVQDNLKSEVIGAVNNLTLSGDVKLDEQAVEALYQHLNATSNFVI